jgi:hypothetical protein
MIHGMVGTYDSFYCSSYIYVSYMYVMDNITHACCRYLVHVVIINVLSAYIYNCGN